jgi:hypothetical protein
MKGVVGLVIAAILASAGGACNWLYIQNQADRYKRIGFVKVDTSSIKVGDKFKEGHFARVDFPEEFLGNIETVAVKWIDLQTIVGQVATRDYSQNQLVLHEDLRTPPSRPLNEMIGPNEIVMWLPVDPRSFNPSHVNPGDMVSFRFPRGTQFPRQVGQNGANDEPIAHDVVIGKFRILALGNRRGSTEVARAAGQRGGAENVIAISVETDGTDVETKAVQISELLAKTNFKGVQVLLHPASVSNQADPK